MRKLVQKFLASLARRIVNKYKPLIIGITGSVGKTSAKEAIFLVASQKYKAWKTEKNFNNEFGLPFAVVGIKNSPGKNPFLWLSLFFKALILLMLKQPYPEILILEMGIDRPGDMDYLLSIVKPQIGIITSIGVSHLEYFQNLEQLENEKGKLAKALPPQGVLILNADNQAVLRQKAKTKARVLTYGLSNSANVNITITKENLEDEFSTAISVQMPKQTFQSTISAVGTTHLSSLSSAIAVAEVLKLETNFIQKAMREYRPAPGRLNILSGIRQSIIIDDTYNAAPDSMEVALNLFAKFSNKYKIAILGDMLELGGISELEHKKIGEKLESLKVNKLITVGKQASFIAAAAKEQGLPASDILQFSTSMEAKNMVEKFIQPESLVLVKGSQGMRMEKITLEILAQPMEAKQLLCRQDSRWLNS